MGYIYLSIIWLIILVIVQEVRICNLKSRMDNLEKNLMELMDFSVKSTNNQMKLNEQFLRNIKVLSGINVEDLYL